MISILVESEEVLALLCFLRDKLKTYKETETPAWEDAKNRYLEEAHNVADKFVLTRQDVEAMRKEVENFIKKEYDEELRMTF